MKKIPKIMLELAAERRKSRQLEMLLDELRTLIGFLLVERCGGQFKISKEELALASKSKAYSFTVYESDANRIYANDDKKNAGEVNF